MEVALKKHYNAFPEFQGNFYWSSASGKGGDEDNNARATKIDPRLPNLYVESSNSNDGAKDRNDTSVRIRAFRIDRKKR